MIWAVGASMFLFSCKSLFFFSALFFLDPFSLCLTLLLPMLLYLIWFFPNPFLDSKSTFKGWLYFNSIVLFLFGSFTASDPFLFLISFELCVFPMMYVFLLFSKDSDKLDSVLFMMLMNLFGSIPFMWYVSVWFTTDNFGYAVLIESFSDYIVFISFCLLLVMKFPIFMGHVWLTKAHVSGSGFCSMILASVMLKLGTFGFYKFIKLFQKLSLKVSISLAALCLIGSIYFLISMVRGLDGKLLVASSSVVHMASIIPAICVLTSSGLLSSIFMMMGHGFISFILFMLVSLIYENSHSRSMDTNKSLESVSKTFMMIFFLFLFFNLGLPPFMSFVSELFFCLFYFELATPLFLLFCLVMLVSILYVMFFIYSFLFGKKELNHYLFIDVNFMTWCFFITGWFVFSPMIF